MSFLEPIRLWLFLGLAAIFVIYAFSQTRRGKYALEFSDASLLDAVAPRRPGWRRHVVAVTFLAVLGFLIVAFARPVVERDVPRERAVVILTIDTSLSMGSEDVAPSRIEAAQEAARQFLENAPDTIDIGLVSFDENAIVQVPPTDDRALVEDAVDDLELGPFTNTGGAISVSLRTLEGVLDDLQLDDDDAPPAVIVLLSDGEPTIDDRPPITTAIAQSVQAGISISTVALGTPNGEVTIEDPDNPGNFMTVPVPVDEDTMRNVADATGGQFFSTASVDELAAVYDDIGTAVGFETIDDDISERFVGIALAFAFLTSLLSLAWFQRLP
ncbi:MAG: VWA domain-containing protein [Actinomycetota bacterium]